MVEIGSVVSCRGHEWSVMAHEASPRGTPPYLRLARIDEHGNATALVVGPDSVEVIGVPRFVMGDDVNFGLDNRGAVVSDDGGEFVEVIADFRRTYDGGSKHKVARTVPVPRSLLSRDNIGLSLNRIG